MSHQDWKSVPINHQTIKQAVDRLMPNLGVPHSTRHRVIQFHDNSTLLKKRRKSFGRAETSLYV